ncbi:TM2 domain-containing protein [Chitinophaga sp. Cy-1792]|uniref:TM2 domain-containing protein n=1 Tax=Chitinophaga sp. Cy-1792 TaxID=2608339 RepID=UPI001423AF49|nr:TM2 domain-containing protein [Chitinophaga sp. Cy-1792]NIG52500.1 TM2 domain-containing protein [Chitinophaga sp. Cy-1792]
MNNFSYNMLPGIEPEEKIWLDQLTSAYTQEKKDKFLMLYQSKRRDPQSILIFTLLGLVGFAGVHRFVTDRIGLGIIYFFTCGIFFLGTLIDAINYKRIAWDFNKREAVKCSQMIDL